MLKKRTETKGEIERYYNRLKDRVLSKLKQDERDLLNVMEEKVDRQNMLICEKIEQCKVTNASLQEKTAMLQTMEQTYRTERGNRVEYLKQLVKASNYMNKCEQVKKDITTVRDQFLVIRFFVNSETEETILNSNVACVEILNSDSAALNGDTLESERINEVAQSHGIAVEAAEPSHGGSVTSTDADNELRVDLPTVHERGRQVQHEVKQHQQRRVEAPPRINRRSPNNLLVQESPVQDNHRPVVDPIRPARIRNDASSLHDALRPNTDQIGLSPTRRDASPVLVNPSPLANQFTTSRAQRNVSPVPENAESLRNNTALHTTDRNAWPLGDQSHSLLDQVTPSQLGRDASPLHEHPRHVGDHIASNDARRNASSMPEHTHEFVDQLTRSQTKSDATPQRENQCSLADHERPRDARNNALSLLENTLPFIDQVTPNQTRRDASPMHAIPYEDRVSQSQARGNESLVLEIPQSATDQIRQLINEFDSVHAIASVDVSECISNESILSTLEQNVIREADNSTCEVPNDPELDLVSEQTNEINTPVDELTLVNISSESDVGQSAAITANEQETSLESNTRDRDDDPPPPYPGLPSSPLPPGPDELPPPYPGGPPPPYSQLPESQQRTSRGSQSDESGTDRAPLYMPRHFSDTELQSRMYEIAAPTQTTTPRLSRPKVSKVFSVNEANDRRVSGIFAVSTIHDNSFLVIDRWNKKLKYFNSAGDSFGGLIFREEPWDITDMTDDVVAVTVPKLNIVYKIKATEHSIITISTIPTLRSYACLTFCKMSQLFICGQVPQFGEPVIDIVGVNGGQIIQSFRSDVGNPILRFSYPRYVKVTDDGTAIVCDWNLKCLVVFKLDGQVVGRYRGTVEFPLNEPTGITYNPKTKEIYVIDVKHNSTLGAIHIVSLDCRCKEIVRWDNEFRIARTITPHGTGYALGNKSGVLSIFSARQRR